MPDTINNESTPSLVGASVRSVQDQERDAELSLSSSRSPSKSNQKKGISHHDDYTSVNELVDEGALIHDEQAYDDLLDDTGKLRPSVSQTSIPGVKDEVPHIKLPKSSSTASRERKPPAIANEVKLEDLEKEAEEAKEDSPSSTSEPSVEPERKHSIYELKNNAGATTGANDMSLEDLIDSQIASMTELSTDFQKRISDKKTKPKVLESSRSRSRRRSNSGVIPDSVIENDSLQQVPAGAHEGVYSPLVQSRSQSAIRSTKSFASDASPEKPHLARGDSYKGAHSEYRPGRRPNREDNIYANISQPSKEFLRSVSRSRSRVSKESPVSNKELLDEGALLNDPEHRFDMDTARDDAIDHIDGLHHETLNEESEEEDEKVEKESKQKPVHNETESVEEINKEPKETVATEAGTDVEIPQKVPKLAEFEEEELTTPEDSVKDDKDTEVKATDESEAAVDAEESSRTGKAQSAKSEVENPKKKETEDTKPLKSIPKAEEPVEDKTEKVEKSTETTTSKAVEIPEETPSTTKASTEQETVDTETGQNVDIPKDEEDVLTDRKDDNTTEPEILPKDAISTVVPGGVKEEAEHAVEDEAKEDPIEPKETLEQSDQEKQEEAIEKLDEQISKEADSKPGKKEAEVHVPVKKEEEEEDENQSIKITPTTDYEESDVPVKVDDEAENDEANLSKGVSALKVDDAAGEAERLIKELEDAIDDGDESLTSAASKEKTIDTEEAKPTETKPEVESVAKDLSKIVSKDKGDSEINVVNKEATKTTEETPKAEQPEEIHEPTKDEIIELLKNEPVYIYTSLAGGGFHMPTRTNKLATILTGNRIPFTYRDLGTDEQARNVWRRYGRGRLLPAVVRGSDDIIGNWEEIEEANEDYRVRELIYETL